jgi:hypothetical protein
MCAVEIASMPEDLFNLENAVHTDKTFYFGEGNDILAQGQACYNCLVIAIPFFRAAIVAQRQYLINNGMYVGFR